MTDNEKATNDPATNSDLIRAEGEQETAPVNLTVMHTRADFVPETISNESRTIELVWTTGERGQRPYSNYCDEPHYEELGTDPENIRMERLENGAPFLNNHNSGDLDAVIGSIERVWLANGRGHAVVRFAKDEASNDIFEKVKDGILRNISVGYKIHKIEMIGHTPTGFKVFRATDWEPMELSMVPIGFDSQAQTRGENATTHEAELITRTAKAAQTNNPNEVNMIDEVKQVDAPEVSERATEPVQAQPVQVEPKAAEVAAVRNDAPAILDAVRKAGLDLDFASDLVSKAGTIDEARAAILDELSRKQPEVNAVPNITVGQNGQELLARGMADYIGYRANGSEMTDEAKEFRGFSLIDMAKEVAGWHGVNTRGMDKNSLLNTVFQLRGISGGHTTSDFSSILADATNKQLRSAYDRTPRTYEAFSSRRVASDFKDLNSPALGGVSEFEKVNEHGEFNRGKIGEENESYAVATYGKIIAITRQAIINDDLGAFATIPSKMGSAASDTKSSIVYGLLSANAAMADGVTFFHSSRANTSAQATIGTTPINLARVYLRTVTGIDDARPLNLMARWLICGPAKETEAEQFVAQRFYPATVSNIVPDSMRLEVIVDPRITADEYYIAADTNRIEAIQYANLQDQDDIYTETRDGFEVDGVEIKARMDFGAGLIDPRAMYRIEAT